MRHASIPVLLALVLFSAATEVHAQTGPQPGNCTLGTAQADLDINDVFARVFNTGSLFYGNQTTAGDGYIVPKAALHSSVFASGLWVGGKVGTELRVAGSRYEEFNFWPGPLDGATGRPVNPDDCGPYDRIFSVSRIDIAAGETGNISPDLRDWPFELGAPVVDGDGNPNNYNFAGGDRPDIVGDQGLWWIMNDVGNDHAIQNTPPLGIEVQVLAFAFSRSDALGSTTFYKYRIINKGNADITDTYVSIFSDPDLGDFNDDFVGSDPEAGLGYVYNKGVVDTQYGIPPAVGYDFFQGPIVADGPDAGSDADTLGTSSISYFRNVGGADPTADPSTGEQIYNYQQGLWSDGTPMRARGNGYGAQGGAPITKFMFPGDPVTNEAWSEFNTGGDPPVNEAGDRRFAIHTGPFILARNVPQDIVFGVVFGQGTSNLNSITAMRAADRLAQAAYDANFALAPPPDSPPLCQEGNPVLAPGSGQCLEAVEQNGQVTIVWGYPPNNRNYLGRFEQVDALLEGQNAPDNTYNFEGFNIYRYPTRNFSRDERELVATYDVVNGVTRVLENRLDPVTGATRPFLTAEGSDSGVQYSFDITGLTNYQDYYYGVSAYAYNDFSVPKVNESRPTEITVRPARLANGAEAQSAFGDSLIATPVVRGGSGNVRVRIVDPTQVTGDTYQVRFFRPTNADGSQGSGLTYSVTNTTTNTVAFDGQAYYNTTGGRTLPIGENIAIADGFTFDLRGPQFDFATFVATRRADGPLVPFEYASAQFNGSGFPSIVGETLPNGTAAANTSPRDRQQVGPAEWIIQQGADPTVFNYAAFRRLVVEDGTAFERIGTDNYEWRFTGTSVAYRPSDGGRLTVPFQLWNTGITDDDPSDDVRLIPYVVPAPDSVAATTANTFDLSRTDHAISGNINDPMTDLLSWYYPTLGTPGQAGYDAFAAGGVPNLAAVGPRLFANMVLVSLNGGAITGPPNQAVPEQGTIFRIVTTKPFVPGDTYTFSTANLQLTTPEGGREAALDRIAAVPNPYLGGSSYESGNIDRVVRFTNLPEAATTIRIFTVSGSLVNTLQKEGSSRSLDWNLETSGNLPVASGMYLVHVQVADGGGERTLKLAIINRRTQIRAF